ncbi:hypothetical protein ACFQ0G_51215 [Streptomyces chiangmaiensis]
MGEVDQVWLKDRGFNILRVDGAYGAEMYGVVAPGWLNRRFRRRPEALRAVDAIRALHADPALRPTGHSAPDDRGRPIGLPLLAVNSALALALVVFG